MTTPVKPSFRPAVDALKVLVSAYRSIFFRTPASRQLCMPEIAAEVDALHLYTCHRDDSIDPRAEEVWVFTIPCGPLDTTPATRRAFILRRRRAVWVNVGDLETGLSGGLIYQIAGAFAHNNGLELIGDPDGITEAGKRRRLENLIALSLKYGTTHFVRPHDDMLGWHGLMWGADDDTNLYYLLRTSRKLVGHFYPEMNDVRFDFDTGRFHRNGMELGPVAFSRLAAQKRGSWGTDAVGAPGGGTLRFSILFQSLLEATTDRGRLAGGTLGGLCRPDSLGAGYGFDSCRY